MKSIQNSFVIGTNHVFGYVVTSLKISMREWRNW